MELDLTRRPPRSPRVRLGGYVLLPRVLDKCRASLAGSNGEYNYNCPLDQRFFSFFGIDADAFKAEVAKGRGDGEMLEWVNANSASKPRISDIMAWSRMLEQDAPGAVELRKFFTELHEKVAPHRSDIATWFDLLDLDDYVSFGGKP
jgi:hypothetical protein